MIKKSAFLRLHLVVFLWGFTAIVGKLIDTSATTLVFYRMLFAAGFLYFFIRFIKKQSIKISRKLFLQLSAIGGFMAFHWLCFFYSIKVSNVSIALLCLSLSTLFASVIEPIVFKRKINAYEVVVGLIILFSMGLIFNAEFHYKEGIFYGVLTAIFGTIYSVLNGKIYGKTHSSNIIFYEIFSGFLILTLFYFSTGQIGQLVQVSLRDILLILFLASFLTALPMLESVDLMKYFTPYTLILTVNLEPIYGIIIAFFIFGESEKMSPVFYFAASVMIFAIIINGVLKNRKSRLQN